MWFECGFSPKEISAGSLIPSVSMLGSQIIKRQGLVGGV